MKLRIDGRASSSALEALGPHMAGLYATLGSRRLVVAEIASVERTEIDPDEDREANVKVRFAQLEVAGTDQEETLRQALWALHLHRTATGTLTEDGEVRLAASTLEATAGQLHAAEAARLRVGLEHCLESARRPLRSEHASVTDLRHGLDVVAQGLQRLLHGPAGQLPLPDGDGDGG